MSTDGDALVGAALSHDVEQVRTLLERIDVDAPDSIGNTALINVVHSATDLSTLYPQGENPKVLEVLRLLIEHGANVDVPYTTYVIRTGIAGEGNFGHEAAGQESTALVYALKAECGTMAMMLIGAGANVDARDHKSGDKAVTRAIFDCEVLRMMLERGADANATTHTTGCTLLMNAAAAGRPKVVKLLIEKGANARAKDDQGRTALHGVRDTEVRSLLRGRTGLLSFLKR